MSDRTFVFSQRADWVLWNETDFSSVLNISTEAGSRGAFPPFGEATVRSHFSCSSYHGWANSGWGGIFGVSCCFSWFGGLFEG
jgi:hypothetical protein